MSNPINGADVKSHGSDWKVIFQDIVVGGSSGAVAALPIVPMIYFKNFYQNEAFDSSQKISRDPRVWYRGSTNFAVSFIPSIAVQRTANEWFSRFGMDAISSATGAGIASSLIVCPTECIMIQQQRTGEDFWTTVKKVHFQFGIRGIFKGLLPTSVREGTFTAAYVVLGPKLKEKLEEKGCPQYPARILSGIFSGAAAALASHPFDTCKTRMQQDLTSKKSMLQRIFKENAFAGLKWRSAIVSTAITIIPAVQDKIKERM
ncbi:MAG: hypothetical protein Tsb0015_16730 [Simkaniaceae bacterium]